jgi:hypothetical protein
MPSTGNVKDASATLKTLFCGNVVKHKLANNVAMSAKTENFRVTLIMSVPNMNKMPVYLGLFD